MGKRRIKDGPGQIRLGLFDSPPASITVKAQAAAVPVNADEVLLVDGCNVMNVWNDSRRGPSLTMLLVLLIEAARAKRKFCCIFDANAPFLLQRFAGERVFDVYKDLLKIFPNQFAQTTGGLPADELLLQRADALSRRRIVSNDRFRQFRDKYPWLANEENHLVKFAVVADKLQVPALNIIVDWDRRISQLGKELIPLLSIA